MNTPHLGNVAIIGAGGQAKETFTVLQRLRIISDFNFVGFYVTFQAEEEFLGYPVRELKDVDPNTIYHIAIGNERVRRKIVESMPSTTKWLTIIDPSAIIGEDVEIGEGSFIGQNSIITENVSIGKHTHLNIDCTVSHDTHCGDYMTMAPGARIMGGCLLGEEVYLGASSAVKDKISICDNTVIGMGAMVVKNIHLSGTYVGIPAKKMK